jgi:hypothetical protein
MNEKLEIPWVRAHFYTSPAGMYVRSARPSAQTQTVWAFCVAALRSRGFAPCAASRLTRFGEEVINMKKSIAELKQEKAQNEILLAQEQHKHFHATQVKRSAGQSAMASAAYRAGEKLYSEYYGMSATTPARAASSVLKSCCPPTPRRNTQTAKRYGTPWKKRSAARKPSLHTASILPCRTSFLWMRTSLLQGNFCWIIS